jgi:erythronate-4-phosphate dehydrogenase
LKTSRPTAGDNAATSAVRIVADADMPLVEQLFSRFGPVTRLPGRAIDRDALREADVLLVRSITRVDAALLADTPVRFVGSATIGMDHLDLDAMLARGIPVVNAPGCNARAVAEYVLAAVLELCRRQGRDWRALTVGIVGAGNVGGRVAALWRGLGVRVMVCDPPLAARGVPDLLPLDALREADVLCFHVPLVREGPWPSVHLVDERFLAGLRPGTVLLNAGRGEVFDNRALLACVGTSDAPRLVLDVWEGEPRPLPALVSAADIATPHVAGHSVEGKLRGTWQVYEAFCAWMGKAPEWSWADCLPPGPAPVVDLPEPGPQALCDVLRQVLPLCEDDALLKAACGEGAATVADGFDHLRRGYRVRREFPAIRFREPARLARWPTAERDVLSVLGFHVEDIP